MNKEKIGKYLKEIRFNKKREKDGKSFSRDDLANEFYKRDKELSNNAIVEWESGKALPSLENLEILSEIFNKTLDELLDGEDRKIIDYKKEYFICNPNWGVDFDKKDSLYQIRNEQIKKITDRFKELLKIRMLRDFSLNEEDEFSFLFNNFYYLSQYAHDYSKLKIKDNYLILKDAISEMLVEIRNMNEKEKYWELQKLFHERKILWFTFMSDVHDLKSEKILSERFNSIEDWKKDMLLAMFQNLEPFDANADKYGSHYLKRYEQENGKFDHESTVKDEIRELINHGACFNKYFFNKKKKFCESKRIIDRLEELYNLCLKPIKIQTEYKDGNYITYKIENNLKNRFLNKYYFPLKYILKETSSSDNQYSDIDEIYNWFISNDKVPDESYLEIAKRYNIDTTQEKKYWIADVKRFCNLQDKLDEFKNIETQIENGLIEIEDLKEKLEKGEKRYQICDYKILGGNDEESIRFYIEFREESIDYSEYLRNRDKNLTNNLLHDLDNLSLDEIKDKYFKIEVIENE